MQQASFDKGSFASLLGVRMADGGRAIQVLSVGDSLAVLCDGDRIKATFPLSTAAEFTRLAAADLHQPDAQCVPG